MKKYIIIAVVILAAVAGYFIFGRSAKTNYDFVVVGRQDVIQQVSVTGRVEPMESVDLAFEKGGRISLIKVEVGDKVYSGQTLLSLENNDLSAQLLQSEASLKIEQAELQELLLGTRSEEIQVQEAKVQSAAISLENARKSLLNKIEDAYTKSEDAVRNKSDQFFDNPRSQNAQINIEVSDSQLEQKLNQSRIQVEAILISIGLLLFAVGRHLTLAIGLPLCLSY